MCGARWLSARGGFEEGREACAPCGRLAGKADGITRCPTPAPTPMQPPQEVSEFTARAERYVGVTSGGRRRAGRRGGRSAASACTTCTRPPRVHPPPPGVPVTRPPAQPHLAALPPLPSHCCVSRLPPKRHGRATPPACTAAAHCRPAPPPPPPRPPGGMDQAISVMGMPGIAKLVEFHPVGGRAGGRAGGWVGGRAGGCSPGAHVLLQYGGLGGQGAGEAVELSVHGGRIRQEV